MSTETVGMRSQAQLREPISKRFVNEGILMLLWERLRLKHPWLLDVTAMTWGFQNSPWAWPRWVLTFWRTHLPSLCQLVWPTGRLVGLSYKELFPCLAVSLIALRPFPHVRTFSPGYRGLSMCFTSYQKLYRNPASRSFHWSCELQKLHWQSHIRFSYMRCHGSSELPCEVTILLRSEETNILLVDSGLTLWGNRAKSPSAALYDNERNYRTNNIQTMTCIK